MKKKTKLIIWISVPIVLLFASVGSLYWMICDAFYIGPLDPPVPMGWNELVVGMDQQDVRNRLGKPGNIQVTITGHSERQEKSEFWEYTYTQRGDLPMPDHRAHVLWFSSDGKLIKWREPEKE